MCAPYSHATALRATAHNEIDRCENKQFPNFSTTNDRDKAYPALVESSPQRDRTFCGPFRFRTAKLFPRALPHICSRNKAAAICDRELRQPDLRLPNESPSDGVITTIRRFCVKPNSPLQANFCRQRKSRGRLFLQLR